jgi:hypothetical protein
MRGKGDIWQVRALAEVAAHAQNRAITRSGVTLIRWEAAATRSRASMALGPRKPAKMAASKVAQEATKVAQEAETQVAGVIFVVTLETTAVHLGTKHESAACLVIMCSRVGRPDLAPGGLGKAQSTSAALQVALHRLHMEAPQEAMPRLQ